MPREITAARSEMPDVNHMTVTGSRAATRKPAIAGPTSNDTAEMASRVPINFEVCVPDAAATDGSIASLAVIPGTSPIELSTATAMNHPRLSPTVELEDGQERERDTRDDVRHDRCGPPVHDVDQRTREDAGDGGGDGHGDRDDAGAQCAPRGEEHEQRERDRGDRVAEQRDAVRAQVGDERAVHGAPIPRWWTGRSKRGGPAVRFAAATAPSRR
jgi:hypothetical protein